MHRSSRDSIRASSRQPSVRRASTESQQSSNGERSSIRFFRKLISHRANDYHDDTAVRTNTGVNSPIPHTIDERADDMGDEGDYYAEDQGAQRPSLWVRMCGNDCWSSHRRKWFVKKVLKSTAWRATIVICSVILLFGAQIRTLAFEEPADFAFDIIFCVTFGIFLVDIGMRIDTEPNYFTFNMGGCCRPREDNTAPVPSRRESDSGWGDCNFKLGSFLFFCELASTLALLHEISFIHKKNFDEKQVDIVLDQAGIPVEGMDDVNESSPIEYKGYSLLFTIAKTARVARFIRSTTAIKLSSKVNWFGLFNLLNPLWYFSRCRRMCSAPVSTEEKLRNSSSTEMHLRTPSDSSMGARGANRNQGWGQIRMGALAAVRSRRNGRPNALLRWMGVKGRNDDWKRNLAATKIQRAWRAAKYHHDNGHDLDHSERDFAWKARSSTVSQNAPMRSMPTGSTGRGFSRNQFSRASHRSPLAHSYSDKKQNESQVGSAMRELTGQRVAIGIILVLVLTVLFTYTEQDATRPATMIVLHNQTANEQFAWRSIQAAIDSSAPDLFQYTFANGTTEEYVPADGESTDDLRDSEILQVTVTDVIGNTTRGLFSYRDEARQEALVSLLSTVFIILVWFFGVTAFVGPVMVLVVIPIERMVRLLGMLTLDPLGYQSTSRYRKFVAEEDEITKNTRWTKEILRGMETSFLMLTILRIGSLMKVGFGSAGVEIIRNNLARSQTKNTLILSEKGGTVSCIFLFCDIRQFTDATECLQEEVFVFTNRIAGVVHSICHSFGGSANKNIGDAFLLSWRLEEEDGNSTGFGGRGSGENFVAKHNQADKALLSVVKICMALHHDDYYIETMSETAREALLAKLSKRKGPVVQLGFGLHAGKAVQGAIGSQRKIDATYVSEAVERAEFLESSTKKYGVKMLMSDSFHRLLHPNNRRRCRKVDQIMIQNEDDEEYEEGGEIMELMTFDMDIDALWKNVNKNTVTGSIVGKSDEGKESDSDSDRKLNQNPRKLPGSNRKLAERQRQGRRISVRMPMKESSDELSDGGFLPTAAAAATSSNSNADLTGDGEHQASGPPELVLPTGPALYNASVWVSEDMRRIRQLYSDGIFFQKFNAGLNSYYSRDWEHARQCFVTILERFEDGPSRYFLTQIEKNNGKPPRNFRGYGTA
eukprot:CAMPEP_0172451694 /NCGR_PEP_ID=MMETSP1065-20121228/9625_1 /TAXON_ID=265537 /ORGANISM="Amphiprora paludosa, Strain CCMP125" /LENGTH=1163 /DNA_ID=CAMNT_0013203661 /DNA_START=207 /DNA_END=3698 /DNA_ORIENTATION=+